jgi:CRP/FNR family cyclic AMP-dependent transcriptional regulator
MKSISVVVYINLLNLPYPNKFKAYKARHSLIPIEKRNNIYFEDDLANKVYFIEKAKVKMGYYNDDGL